MDFAYSEIAKLNQNVEDANATVGQIKGLRESVKAAREAKEGRIEQALETAGTAIESGKLVVKGVRALQRARAGNVTKGGKPIEESSPAEAGGEGVEMGEITQSAPKTAGEVTTMEYGSGGQGTDMRGEGKFRPDDEIQQGVEESKGEVGETAGASDEAMAGADFERMSQVSDLTSDSGAFSGRVGNKLDSGDTAGAGDIEEGALEASKAGASTGAEAGAEAGSALTDAAVTADTVAGASGGLDLVADVAAVGLTLAGLGMTLGESLSQKKDHAAQHAKNQEQKNIQQTSQIVSSLNGQSHQALTGGYGDIRRPMQGGGSF